MYVMIYHQHNALLSISLDEMKKMLSLKNEIYMRKTDKSHIKVLS